ncbi:MAG: HU family DNA-binding protein [Gammaproteobacteria bacterium]|nr:HU family DNA-binding protein [Gammaproteobacteria bacterium]MYF29169.1 HU family DNA-binding protein [Gammaproteobacteria bacterium]MYK48247.1 HU family DNA-binding protein [Gammaproteobacteria bacterium]
MNKSELTDAIADEADISRASAARALDAALNAIQGSLQNGEPVALVGFGTFSVRERGARTGRNPRTGEEIEIAAAKLPAFKPGKALKDALN